MRTIWAVRCFFIGFMLVVVYANHRPVAELFNQIMPHLSIVAIVLITAAVLIIVKLGGFEIIYRLGLLVLIVLFGVVLADLFTRAYGPTPLAFAFALIFTGGVAFCFTAPPEPLKPETPAKKEAETSTP